MDWALGRVDPLKRISDVVPVASLQGGLGWRTRAEHERNPGSMAMHVTGERVAVNLIPARLHRAAITHEAPKIAEDLTVLLRRQYRR